MTGEMSRKAWMSRTTGAVDDPEDDERGTGASPTNACPGREGFGVWFSWASRHGLSGPVTFRT